MKNREHVVERIRQFNRFYTVLIGTLNKNFLGYEYSVTETRILFEIFSNKSCIAKDVAKKLNMDKSYMSRMMNAFEKKGLIAKEISDKDRRAYSIRLTAKGESVTLDLIRATNVQIAELISDLNETECQKICEAMDLITDYFSR